MVLKIFNKELLSSVLFVCIFTKHTILNRNYLDTADVKGPIFKDTTTITQRKSRKK